MKNNKTISTLPDENEKITQTIDDTIFVLDRVIHNLQVHRNEIFHHQPTNFNASLMATVRELFSKMCF